VTLGNTVMKADCEQNSQAARRHVLGGFAGTAADAFALLERFEAKLKDNPGNVPRAATELAKEWRMDRAMRRLESVMIVADAKHSLLVSGTGDVIQPSDGILGIGSGGSHRVATSKGLVIHSSLSAAGDRSRALKIAGESSSIDTNICGGGDFVRSYHLH